MVRWNVDSGAVSVRKRARNRASGDCSSSSAYPPLLGLRPGQDLGGRYTVDRFLGAGWEGEVYKVIEAVTKRPRAAKFYVSRGERSQRQVQAALQAHARKLEKLRGCSMVLQYHHVEEIDVESKRVPAMIGEYSPGLPLDVWLPSRRGGRLPLYEAFTLLHGLSHGLAAIHGCGEYHGDLHAGNVLIRRRGILFDLKILDFFNQGRVARRHFQQDVQDIIHIFYDCLGGKAEYAKLPPEAKYVCRGMQGRLIRERFPSAVALCKHLESFSWN